MKRLLPLLVAALICFGCPSPGVSPVVGSLVVSSGQEASFVKYDGQKMVARWRGAAEAALYWKGLGMPVYPPVILADGRQLAIDHENDIRIETFFGDVFPSWAEELFRPSEAHNLGVTFSDE